MEHLFHKFKTLSSYQKAFGLLHAGMLADDTFEVARTVTKSKQSYYWRHLEHLSRKIEHYLRTNRNKEGQQGNIVSYKPWPL